MIRQIFHWKEEWTRQAQESALGTRLAGLVAAYGLDQSFFQVYQVGKTGFLSCLDGTLTLWGEPEDGEELSAFFPYVAGTSLWTAKEMALSQLCRTTEMIWQFRRPVRPPPQICVTPLSPKEATAALQVCEAPLANPEGFYVDFSHRSRHGYGRARGVLQGGKPIAVALTASELYGSALVSGVIVAPNHRGKGIGKWLVQSLTEELRHEGKRVYLWCEPRVCGFYEALGYQGVRSLFQYDMIDSRRLV